MGIESRPRAYDQCVCGGNKAKTSVVCWTCYSDGRPSKKDLCSCGKEKMRSSGQCDDCERLNRRKNSTAHLVRGPSPKLGEAAIYLLRDRSDKVFYVGSTTNPRQRLLRHHHKFGNNTTMLVIKIVDESVRWEEEMIAALTYKDLLPNGILDARRPN